MSDAQERLASIDFLRLNHWLRVQGLADGEVEAPTLLAGGTQNLIVRFRCGGRAFVLRKAAGTAYANGSETMRREARILAALAAPTCPMPALSRPATTMRCWAARFTSWSPWRVSTWAWACPSPTRSSPPCGVPWDSL